MISSWQKFIQHSKATWQTPRQFHFISGLRSKGKLEIEQNSFSFYFRTVQNRSMNSDCLFASVLKLLYLKQKIDYFIGSHSLLVPNIKDVWKILAKTESSKKVDVLILTPGFAIFFLWAKWTSSNATSVCTVNYISALKKLSSRTLATVSC